MSKIQQILIIIFVAGVVATSAQITRPALLSDGFILSGLEGKLIGSDSNETWHFELGSDVNDNDVIVKAQTNLKLLPSATLERLVADVNERRTNHCLLWGRITKYKGTNFIFPYYFLPLQPQKEPEQPVPAEAVTRQDKDQKTVIKDPNDLLTIPKEVIEKLEAARARTTANVQRPADNKKTQNQQTRPTNEEITTINTRLYTQNNDSVLIDRTALLVGRKEEGFIFVLDAFGRNVPQVSLQLLPCEMLELTEQRQSAVSETVRFKIAGIMTKYKGKNYLLLQKATRIYSHGNFGR